MSEKEISIFAEETREWVRQQRARRPIEVEQPYSSQGGHVIVGRERPLSADFLSTAESSAEKE